MCTKVQVSSTSICWYMLTSNFKSNHYVQVSDYFRELLNKSYPLNNTPTWCHTHWITCSNQLGMVKNIHLDTKIILNWQEAETWILLLALLLCLCTFDIAEICSNQLSMVKNVYLVTKINPLWCQGAELHLEVGLDPVVGIVVGVGVHWAVLKPVPINSAWSKTYI